MNPYLHINRLEFVLTDHCTGRCKHCSVGERVAHPRREHHVPRQAAEQAIRFLADEYDMASVMTFGGEPLLYPEITCAIHRTAAECAIPCRQIITNGYFSRDEERIRQVARMLAEAGVKMTAAGATYPYGIDPEDSNIRIAPSLPPVEELEKAITVFCTCLKMAALEKLGV